MMVVSTRVDAELFARARAGLPRGPAQVARYGLALAAGLPEHVARVVAYGIGADAAAELLEPTAGITASTRPPSGPSWRSPPKPDLSSSWPHDPERAEAANVLTAARTTGAAHRSTNTRNVDSGPGNVDSLAADGDGPRLPRGGGVLHDAGRPAPAKGLKVPPVM